MLRYFRPESAIKVTTFAPGPSRRAAPSAVIAQQDGEVAPPARGIQFDLAAPKGDIFDWQAKRIRWTWAPCCTDGVAIENLGSRFDFRVLVDQFDGLNGVWKARSRHPNGRTNFVNLDPTKPLRLVAPGSPAGRR